MKEPEKRIKWGKHTVSDDMNDFKDWEEGKIDDATLIANLRSRYMLGRSWTNTMIMENVYWLGYGRDDNESDN